MPAHRTCLNCGTAITPQAKRCRPCANIHTGKNPVAAAKKSASLRRYGADPANRATIRRRSVEGAKTRWSNPEYAERTRRNFVEVVQPASMNSPDVTESRRKAARLSAESRMAWCAPAYQDDYRHMVRSGIKAVEARRVILARIAADKPAREPMTFEQQLAAVANGAALYAIRPWGKDYSGRTLGGVCW